MVDDYKERMELIRKKRAELEQKIEENKKQEQEQQLTSSDDAVPKRPRGRPPMRKAEDTSVEPETEDEEDDIEEEPEEYVSKKEETKVLTELEMTTERKNTEKELTKIQQDPMGFSILRLERKLEIHEDWFKKHEEFFKFFFRHIQSIENENKDLWLQSLNAMSAALNQPHESTQATSMYNWWQNAKEHRDWNIMLPTQKLDYAEKVIDALNLGNNAWMLRNEGKIKPALDQLQEKIRKIFYPQFKI